MKLSLSVATMVLLQCIIAESKQALPNNVYAKIGNLIWRNESGSSVEKLTWWNDGEEFASLGIGHCVWYPSNEKQKFVPVFPELINFFHTKGITIPAWIGKVPVSSFCPWQNREQFFAAFESDKMRELRTLLSQTLDLQVQFMVKRTHEKLKVLLAQAKPKSRSRLKSLLNELNKTSNGIYALIDYINFKGDGMNAQERYNGQGWGLLQVLENMNYTNNNKLIVQQFVDSAKKILTLRVKNSPQARNEQKFLPGWINRLNTYSIPF